MEGYEFDAPAFFRDAKARLRFPFSHLVQPVFDGYDRLLEEPIEYQRLWTFDVAQMQDRSRRFDPDDGLVFKRGEPNVDPKQAAYDYKAYLHYSSRLRPLLLMSGIDIARHVRFLDDLEKLYQACRLGVFAVAQAIDAQAGTSVAAAFLQSTEHKLRLLRYEPGAAGTVIGKSHTDRSAVTVHLAETFPACYVEGELIEAKEDDALVFGSDGLHTQVGGSLPGIHACRHEIIVPPGSGWTTERRRSIVFFGRLDR
jgi:hypothetical protein